MSGASASGPVRPDAISAAGFPLLNKLRSSVRSLFMAKTYSQSMLEEESPQYAYALAILSGGGAYIVSQLVAPRTALLAYALIAALFGFIWPSRPWQWGGWLCLPIAMLICFDILATGNLVGAFLGNGIMFAKVLSCACLGAY